MKRNRQFDKLLARVPEETKRRVDKQLSCKWLRNGDECGKGLPGTPCEIVGCVAWQHYKEDYNEEDHSMALKAIEWLEKQKESLHIPETCKENAEKQTDEEKEYVRTIKSIISDFIRDKKPENLAYYQRIYDWLDGRHVPFSCGHENDKPADPVFSKQEYESHPIISEDTTSAKPADLDGKALLHTADKSYAERERKEEKK